MTTIYLYGFSIVLFFLCTSVVELSLLVNFLYVSGVWMVDECGEKSFSVVNGNCLFFNVVDVTEVLET